MTFDKCIEIILPWEGGYVNDPDDAGGETNFGISKRAYPNLDIAKLTKSKAKEIYKKDYWNKANIENVPEDLKLIFFDTCINMGIGRANSFLVQCQNSKFKYFNLRKRYYEAIVKKKPTQAKFLKGWLNRLNHIYAAV